MKPIKIKEVKNLNLDVHEVESKVLVIPTGNTYIKGLDKEQDRIKDVEKKQALNNLKKLVEGV